MELLKAIARVVASPAFKFFLILFLILLLVIPLGLVYALIWDREGRARSVRAEVGRLWGPEQRVLGPFLVVPYTVRTVTVQGDKRVEQVSERRAVFTPEQLEVKGNIDTRSLRRAIFDIPVYATKLQLSGRFAAPRMSSVAAEIEAIRWGDAAVVLGLSGVSGLKEAAALKIAGRADVPFSPSIGIPGANLTGIHAKLSGAAPDQPAGQPEAFAFTLDLTFNGSVSLMVAPVARETEVSLASAWPHPSFTGAFVPDERRLSPAGFAARWRIPHLARSVPEAWSLHEGSLERLAPHAFGVTLIEPVDFYSLVNRATKYGIAFIALVFMAVLSLELMSRTRVHAVQYLLFGIALVFFFVLLLSLAEHFGFGSAYLLASLATGGMLAVYFGQVMRSRAQGMVMLAVLMVTYAILYLILRLEDYALLAGAILGFIALTLAMFATLRVDWSGGASAPSQQPAPRAG